LPALLPNQRVAELHLVFIGGFMVILLTVGTRVILGHSGLSALFAKPRLPFLIAALSLLIIAMLSRVGADFMPTTSARNGHLVYAALSWILAAVIWASALVPKVFIPDPEE